MAHSITHSERRDSGLTRAERKSGSKKVRRANGRYAIDAELDGVGDDDLTPFWAECVGGESCDCEDCKAHRELEARLVGEAQYRVSVNGSWTTLCACCHKPLEDGDELADNPVYKCGELSYIELAHVRCAPASWRGARAA